MLDSRCECCGNADRPVRVGSSGIGPVSLAWCDICLVVGAEPRWATDAVEPPEGVVVVYDAPSDRYVNYPSGTVSPVRFNDGREFQTRAEVVAAVVALEQDATAPRG